MKKFLQKFRDKLKSHKWGFSLVELIIVIAIMAVLLAVLAPALLIYTERSRAQRDVSAMGEVTNALFLSVSDVDVYDELLKYSEKNNVSCYVDESTESAYTKITTKSSTGSFAEQYTFDDNARIEDEKEYYFAGNMYGVTITFEPTLDSNNDTVYNIKDAVINKYINTDGDKITLENSEYIYNFVRRTVGNEVIGISQTYRNSDYTIFIKMSIYDENTQEQDAVEIYGQYNGTNLQKPAQTTLVVTDRNTESSPSQTPSDPTDTPNEGNGGEGVVTPTVPVIPDGTDPSECPHSSTKLINKTDATCTDSGYTGDKICSDCDMLIERGDVVDPTGNHNYKKISNKEATCEENGLIIWECTECGGLKNQIIETVGHSYGEYIVLKEATCSETGLGQRACSVCGSIDETIIETTEHDLVAGECNDCDYAEAGLYDINGTMLCNWAQSGIDVEMDYAYTSSASNCYKTTSTSPYYVLTNKYTTTTKIILPSNIIKIGAYAFDECINLNTVIIPNSVNSIGTFAFSDCTSLTNVTIPSNMTKITSYTFNNCTSLTNITIPNKVTSIGSYAFYKCSGITSVEIPSSVISIGNETFGSCTSLKNITIPSSVTSIGVGAFASCTCLTDVAIPSSITEIENSIFSGCESLTNITIPSSVTTIGNYVFKDCINLISIEIPSSVVSIGNHTFNGCTGLTNITIPTNVTNIGLCAFANCTNLSSVTFKDTTTWYVGDWSGETTTKLTVTSASTNATYLKTDYASQYWTKK